MENFENLTKEEVEVKIKTLESDLAYGDDLSENERVYRRLLEKSDPEKHRFNIKRAEQKLEDIEKIKELRQKLFEIKLREETQPEAKKPEGKKEIVEIYKTESYSTEFIKETVRDLLLKEKAIKEIESFEIEGKGEKIWIGATLKVEADLYIATRKIEVKIDAILENKNEGIAIKDYGISADKNEKAVIKKIEPYLGSINGFLKEYLENKEGWEVVKMQIENGELRVDFKTEEKIKEEEPEPKASGEPEGSTSFLEGRTDEQLDQLYIHYQNIIANKDGKTSKADLDNAQLQIGYIDAERERRKKAKEQPPKDEPEERDEGEAEATKSFIVTPEWEKFKANELRSLSPDNDAELIELLNNKPIGYLDRMIGEMSGHVEGLVNKETKWPDDYEFEAVETLDKLKNGLIEANKETPSIPEEQGAETKPEPENPEFDLTPEIPVVETNAEKIEKLRNKMKGEKSESETTGGIEGEPLPEFMWKKENFTKKEDGIDYEEERGGITFEIYEHLFSSIYINQRDLVWVRPSPFRKLLKGRGKYIKNENPTWNVYYSIYNGFDKGVYKERFDEFEKQYPDKDFKDKEEAITYGNQIRDAMVKIKDEVEKDLAERKASIESDKKERPLLYYGWEKSNNNYLKKDLFWNKLLGITDLTQAGDDMQFSRLQFTGENEGFFENSPFGFVKIIKNVNKVRTENGINSYSEDAIYKIVGPNNEILADDIKGYTEMKQLFSSLLEKYKENLKKEFEREHVLN